MAALAVLAFVGLLTAIVALTLGGLTLILVFWDTHRVLAAFLVTAGFAAIALAATLVLVRRARRKPRLLQNTLSELAADYRRLRGGQ